MKKTNTDLALNGNNQPEVADVFHLYGENYRKYNPVSYEQRRLCIILSLPYRRTRRPHRALRPVWLRADSL